MPQSIAQFHEEVSAKLPGLVNLNHLRHQFIPLYSWHERFALVAIKVNFTLTNVLFIIKIQLTPCSVIKLMAPWGGKTALALRSGGFFISKRGLHERMQN